MIKVAVDLAKNAASVRCVAMTRCEHRFLKALSVHIPISQYTYSFTSALSDHTTELIVSTTFSTNSQKQSKATPRFQLWRMKLVSSARKTPADAEAQNSA